MTHYPPKRPARKLLAAWQGWAAPLGAYKGKPRTSRKRPARLYLDFYFDGPARSPALDRSSRNSEKET